MTADIKVSDYLDRRYSLESARLPVADADNSLLWLLLSTLDGAGEVPVEFGLARITSRCPPADDLCVADDDVPVRNGMPSNCCLLATFTSIHDNDHNNNYCAMVGTVVQWVEHWTCNQQVM